MKTSVTTHTLRSLLGLLASSLKYLFNRWGKGLRPRSTATSSGGRADHRTFVHGAGGVVNPDSSSCVSALGIGLMGGPILLYFLSLVSVPLIIVPYRLVPRPMFVPKRRSQQGVVDSRAVTTMRLLLETTMRFQH